MPHIPLYVHPDFEGKSEHGLYGDVVQEIDWSVVQVMQTLKECGIDRNTLVIFTSDNGPWLIQGTNGGHAEPLRDGKSTRYEGGHRVACVMSWPEKIKPGTVADDLIGAIDLLPTIARLTGATVPSDRVIDGIDSSDYLLGNTDVSPRVFHQNGERVIRDKDWKLFMPGTYAEFDPETAKMKQVEYKKTRLYHLKQEIGEATDVAQEHPDVVARLKAELRRLNEDVKANGRPLGQVKDL